MFLIFLEFFWQKYTPLFSSSLALVLCSPLCSRLWFHLIKSVVKSEADSWSTDRVRRSAAAAWGVRTGGSTGGSDREPCTPHLKAAAAAGRTPFLQTPTLPGCRSGNPEPGETQRIQQNRWRIFTLLFSLKKINLWTHFWTQLFTGSSLYFTAQASLINGSYAESSMNCFYIL